jgi:hypothetical protein
MIKFDSNRLIFGLFLIILVATRLFGNRDIASAHLAGIYGDDFLPDGQG